MKADIILSTYNHPAWLKKVLWGFAFQTHREFRVLVADDGSDDRTRQALEEVRAATSLIVEHIWHEDDGFRKCRILNRAIAASDADYLVFTDGDCIPRSDFVERHLAAARPGRFLSGGAVRLPLEVSQKITVDDIRAGRAHSVRWLVRHGTPVDKQLRLLLCGRRSGKLLDRLRLTQPTWNGGNASAWRDDIMAVNGYDERMGHGGLDRELGERLVNRGIRPVAVRHQAVCVHLDHSRGYARPEILQANLALRARTRRERLTWTPAGIIAADAQPLSPAA